MRTGPEARTSYSPGRRVELVLGIHRHRRRHRRRRAARLPAGSRAARARGRGGRAGALRRDRSLARRAGALARPARRQAEDGGRRHARQALVDLEVRLRGVRGEELEMAAALRAGPDDAQPVGGRRAVPGGAASSARDPGNRTHGRRVLATPGASYSTFVRTPTERIASASASNDVDFITCAAASSRMPASTASG